MMSDIKWPSRWDAYLEMEGSKVHWFWILNSLITGHHFSSRNCTCCWRCLNYFVWRLEMGVEFQDYVTGLDLLVHLSLEFYMFLGIIAGYVAVWLLKTMNCGDTKGLISISWKVSCFFPQNQNSFSYSNYSEFPLMGKSQYCCNSFLYLQTSNLVANTSIWNSLY